MTKKIIAAVATIVMATTVNAQNIFTYGNLPVDKAEFVKMYSKNTMGKTPDMSAAALKDYIQLYYRFKLKVKEAEAKQIDTLPNIKSELANYKAQLSANYLTDKAETEKLVKEAYDRLKKEVKVAHIMLSIPRGAVDTNRYIKTIDSIYTAATTGTAFAALAKAFSTDKSNNDKGGELGYITALQTPYDFETAAYKTTVGNISKPFRTPFGYHIIKKLEERPSRGEVTVAQILLQVKKSDGADAKDKLQQRADSIVAALNKGTDWEAAVLKFSEDKFSTGTKGELPSFGVATMTPEFEAAAFALTKPGQISKPIFTEYGWHIIKLLKKQALKPLDSIKIEFTKKVERDTRMETARASYINKIKSKGAFVEIPNAAVDFVNTIPDTSIINGTINYNPNAVSNKPMFTINSKKYTQRDFFDYYMMYNKGRVYGDKKVAITAVYKAYQEKSLMDYQQANLEYENPEYAALVKEYRDGIMLFDLTDKTVWTRASTDSAGLATYYNTNKSKYTWAPCFEGKIIKSGNPDNIAAFETELKKGISVDSALSNVPGKVVVEEGKFEIEKYPGSANVPTGNVSSIVYNKAENVNIIYAVDKLYPTPTLKTLAEAKGYVIADYQEYLEKNWIQSMENKYPLQVNEAVLKTLIKVNKK